MNSDMIKLVEYLSNEHMTKMNVLEKYFHLTRRQLLYKIEKINDLLMEKSLEPLCVVQNKLHISEETRKEMVSVIKSYQSIDYVFEKEERFIFMYAVLFIRSEKDYLSTDYFMEELQISRTTIFSDIKKLKQILKMNNIDLKNNRQYGYYLSGKEYEIRNTFLHFFTSILSDKQNTTIFDLIIKKNRLKPFLEAKKIFEKVSEKNDCSFVEKRLDEFVYVFIFLLARMERNNYSFEEFEILESMKTFKEFQFAVDMIEAFGLSHPFSEQDIFYITSWTLSISFGAVDTNTKDFTIISNFVYKVMDRFNLISGFQYEFTDDFFIQLYIHLRPAYYRLLFNIPVINPLTERVKDEFYSLFNLVKETMRLFASTFGQEVPENEIAYLTMHFANVIRNKKFEEEIQENKENISATALIVCSNGIGSSAILYNELVEMFPDLYFYKPISTLQISEFNKPVDIIFSTDYLSDKKISQIPIVRVHPIISSEERYHLFHEVELKLHKRKNTNVDKIIAVVEKYTTINEMNQLRNELSQILIGNIEKKSSEIVEQKVSTPLNLNDLFDIDLIQLAVNANSWEEALKKSYEPLVRKEIVSTNYVEKTIRSILLKGPYVVISENIALAHSKPEDGAFKNALGLTVLKEPIPFGNKNSKPVKYIFTLSINGKADHLEAMADFVQLINDPSFFELLDHTEEKQLVMSHIQRTNN